MRSARLAAPLSIALLAGAAWAHPETAPRPPIALDTPPTRVYYDAGTHELSMADPRAAWGSGPVWLNANTYACTASIGVMIDAPDTDGDGFADLFGYPCDGSGIVPFPCEGVEVIDWDDIPADTVVDRVVIQYATVVPEIITPECQPAQGVPGCDMYIIFNDADNGNDDPGRRCITQIRVRDLPGAVECISPDYHTAFYELVIDLAPSQVFELGDSDAIDDAGTGFSGAALYGAPTFADRDADTLHDFSVSIRFDQSAIPQSQRGLIGYVSSAPKTGQVGDPPPHPADARGLEDVTDFYVAGNNRPPETSEYLGAFFQGGWDCDSGAEFPFASFALELHGPNAPIQCGPADIAPPFGALDFSDVLTFLTAFALEQHWVKKLAPPANASGSPDFSDVAAFLTAFAQGCP